MAAKLSKKELEGPDFFQTNVERLTDYIAENKTRVYVVVTAICLVIALASGIYIYWNNYQASALKLYSEAQAEFADGAQKPEAIKKSISLLTELTTKYPHSPGAKLARYNLGNIYYSQGNIDKAVTLYKEYLQTAASDKGGIKFLVLTSLGYCYEDKKDFKSALSYFEEAQKTDKGGFSSIGYRNTARIYEQMNEKKKARENYQSALQKTTDPAMIFFIKHKIASLG